MLCAYMAFICGVMAYYGVYIVGYAIMAYGLGLRDRRWVWRVWSVVCTVCISYGVRCRRGLSVGYGVHVWRVVGVCMALVYGVLWRWCTVCVGTVLWRVWVRCAGVGCTYGYRVYVSCGVRCVYGVCVRCVYRSMT